MTTTGKDRIMIFGPKTDGTYVVEFRTAEGESLAISIPRTETAVIRHFQERMPCGLLVPDVNALSILTSTAGERAPAISTSDGGGMCAARWGTAHGTACPLDLEGSTAAEPLSWFLA
jgi:hypothetical protein